jgi:hypothetical protein
VYLTSRICICFDPIRHIERFEKEFNQIILRLELNEIDAINQMWNVPTLSVHRETKMNVDFYLVKWRDYENQS